MLAWKAHDARGARGYGYGWAGYWSRSHCKGSGARAYYGNTSCSNAKLAENVVLTLS